MIRWPRASSTAPAMPAAPDASTTTGGDTRNRTSASTTRCAAGRNVRSQSHSCTARSFRERPSALDKRSLVDRLAGADQLSRGVDLAPRVPEQYTARPALPVDVRDEAFAVRLVPPHERGARGADVVAGKDRGDPAGKEAGADPPGGKILGRGGAEGGRRGAKPGPDEPPADHDDARAICCGGRTQCAVVVERAE